MESTIYDVFKVKWIKFRGYNVPFLLQNLDGQCPLICFSNILFLNRKLELPKGCKQIHFDNLCTYICSALPDFNSEWVTSILLSLKKGLLFNCKFDSTTAYIESDPEQLFQTFNIPIKHGWIADPIAYGPLTRLNYDELLEKLTIYQCKSEEGKLKSLLQNDLNEGNQQKKEDKSERNQVSESNLEKDFQKMKLTTEDKDSNECVTKELEEPVEHKSNEDNESHESNRANESDDSSKESENDDKTLDGEKREDVEPCDDDFNEDMATLAMDFLERYATQLTEYGIRVLKHELHELKLVALYRNNHFLVATMHNGQIFSLVTDSSFYGHKCVWESLESCEYFDENFKHYYPKDIKAKKPSILEKWKGAFRRKPKR